MSSRLFPSTPGYDALPLVGRDRELDAIRSFATRDSNQPRVIFIFGDGGVGKTRLLKEALPGTLAPGAAAPASASPNGGQPLVDFYDVRVHAADQFVAALHAALGLVGGPFKAYEAAVEKARNEAAGKLRDQHLQRAHAHFVDELHALSQQRPVVLRLDTLERLIYGPDDASARVADSRSYAWTWFLSVLPRLGPVTVLLAGRERARSLVADLEEITGVDVLQIDLKPLDAATSWEYLRVAADYFRQQGDRHAAEVIDGKLLSRPDVYQPVVVTLSQGRPIFLAMIVDFLARMGDGDIRRLIDTIDGTPEAVPNGEKYLIRRLMNSDDDITRFMGYLPKGVMPRLLAEVMDGLSAGEIARKLAAIQKNALVKITGDRRLFLHDELYDLLERHRIVEPPDQGPEFERVQKAINRYYETEIEAESEAIKDLYPLLETNVDVRDSLNEHTDIYHRLLADDVYYRLRQNKITGMRRWYRYAHEATLAGNQSFDILLEIELLAFLSEHKPDEADAAGDDWVSAGKELLRLGPIRRLWAAENYVEVIKQARAMRAAWPDDPSDEGAIRRAPLAIWEAYALAVRGGGDDAAVAIDLLGDAIASLAHYEDEPLPKTAIWVWLAKVYLAFAYRVRGYIRRVQGLMQNAVDNYGRALALFREVNLRIEIAYTLNDMGFALGEMGRYDEAIEAVETALERRYDLGIGVYIGLSLSTQALIHIQQGQFDRAIPLAQRAIYLFQNVNYRRGAGLAQLALAEALRRLSGSLSARSQMNPLQQALRHSQEAQTIFDDLEEKPRQVEVLIERGCAYRDRARRCVEHPHDVDCANVEGHIQQATHYLERAAELASERILYRQIDALVNLVWLSFYCQDTPAFDRYVSRAEAAVPPGYWLDQVTGQPTCAPNDPDVQRLIWSHLAKLHIALGHQALRRSEAPDGSPDDRAAQWDAAGRYYALALAYDSLFATEHYGHRRARGSILRQVEPYRTNDDALRAIGRGVRAIETDYHLDSAASDLLRANNLWLDDDSA